MNSHQSCIHSNELFFIEVFKLWFRSVTWKKSVMFLVIPFLMLIAASTYLFSQVPGDSRLILWQTERETLYWEGPANGHLLFVFVTTLLMVMCLAFLFQAISSFPFDPNSAYESARSYWKGSVHGDEQEASNSEDFVYSVGSKAINILSVLLLACSYLTDVLLISSTIFFTIREIPNLIVMVVLILTFAVAICSIGVAIGVITTIGLAHVGVVFILISGVLVSVVTNVISFEVVVNLAGVYIGFLASIFISILCTMVLIVAFVLVLDDSPFKFDSEREWRAMLFDDMKDQNYS